MQFGTSKLGEHGAVRLGEENNCFPSASLYLAEVRADGMDALLGSVGVELGLEGTGDGATDEVGELRVLKDAKPGINVVIDTFGSEWVCLCVCQLQDMCLFLCLCVCVRGCVCVCVREGV